MELKGSAYVITQKIADQVSVKLVIKVRNQWLANSFLSTELEMRGALHVDCSGGDYIVTLSVEETMATLTIVAECSTSCSNEVSSRLNR